jgi:hypothetical protein
MSSSSMFTTMSSHSGNNGNNSFLLVREALLSLEASVIDFESGTSDTSAERRSVHESA